MDPSLVFKFWSQRKPKLPEFRPGTSRNIRILRVLDRKLRINPDTPGILPDTPDLEWYIMCLGSVTVPKRYKPFLLSPVPSLTLSRALSHPKP